MIRPWDLEKLAVRRLLVRVMVVLVWVVCRVAVVRVRRREVGMRGWRRRIVMVVMVLSGGDGYAPCRWDWRVPWRIDCMPSYSFGGGESAEVRIVLPRMRRLTRCCCAGPRSVCDA